jgi:hypothetical protein
MQMRLSLLGCIVFGHDDQLVALPDRVYLVCRHCHRTTPGWAVARARLVGQQERPGASVARNAAFATSGAALAATDAAAAPSDEPLATSAATAPRGFVARPAPGLKARTEGFLRSPIIVIRWGHEREPARLTIRYNAGALARRLRRAGGMARGPRIPRPSRRVESG